MVGKTATVTEIGNLFKKWFFLFLVAGACFLNLPVANAQQISQPSTADEQQWIEQQVTTTTGISDFGSLQPYASLVYKLRVLAIILLLIVLVFAAIMSARGSHGVAMGVAIGGLILFGGFWLITPLSSSFDSSSAPTINNPDYTTAVGSGTGSNLPNFNSSYQAVIPPVVKTIATGGMGLLSAAIIPFLIIYGFLLAITFATQGSDPAAASSYIIGASIILGATMIADIFSIL